MESTKLYFYICAALRLPLLFGSGVAFGLSLAYLHGPVFWAVQIVILWAVYFATGRGKMPLHERQALTISTKLLYSNGGNSTINTVSLPGGGEYETTFSHETETGGQMIVNTIPQNWLIDRKQIR